MATMKSLRVILIFCFVLFNYLGQLYALPVFFRGRIRGGNVGEPPFDGNLRFPSQQWFTQRLTHFDSSNTHTWEQKYYVNPEHYKPGGPVFMMIGGEGPLSPKWMVAGQWVTYYAAKYHALCVALEHRFYGVSHPTSDISDESLAYLTSEQALADLANFQTFITNKMNITSKWITFGGSYPGSLSAWYRLKYPHLVTGAVSSSAPLQAVLDFQQFEEVVENSLRLMHSNSCVLSFRNLTAYLEYLIQSSSGRDLLKSKLRLCSNLDLSKPKDISNFFANVAGNVAGVVQYNRDNRAFEGAEGGNITIKTVCDLMTDASVPDVLDRYSHFNDLFMSTYGTKCFEFDYDNMIKELRNPSWSSPLAEGGRQWTYQTCTEFGFFQSSDASDQPFGHHFPAEFFTQQCIDIFGPLYNTTTITSAIKQTNQNYGSLGIKTSNTAFINGNVDPWHALSFKLYKGPSSVAVLINGTAHCANMYPSSPFDSKQLVLARDVVASMIGQWLNQ